MAATVWVAAVMILVSGGVAASEEPDERPIKLQLKWYHQFQFAGYYAAQAQGYYREEGLNVSIIEGDAEHPPIQEVLAGRADFGVSDADVLQAHLQGKPLVVLAAIFQHSPYILMTRADSGLRTPTDLRGKSIMLSDEQGIVQLKAMFQREGMSLNDVRIIPHQWNNELLINRQVDAISAYSTVEPFQLKARGVEPGMIRAMDYGVDFYGDTLFTTGTEVERRPEQVAAFRRASLRGWEYAMAHPEEIVELILDLPGVKERGITREMLRFEASAMQELILPGLVDIGHMNPGRWQAIARIYANIGMIERAPSEAQLQEFIYSSAAPNRERWVMPLLLGLGALALVALVVLGWNLQLRRSVARRTAALQQAEQQISYHVENSPLGVIEWDHNFRVTRWTGQAEQVFGWKAVEVLGKQVDEWRFIHEQDRALVEHTMTDLVGGRKPQQVVRNRNYRKDGSVAECEWYNSVSLDKQGKVASIFSLVLDVTARTRAEQELRASEERLRKAIATPTVGVLFFSLAGRVQEANGAIQRMSGYTLEELRTLEWKTLTAPECWDVTARAAEELANTGETSPYEKQMVRKDGSRWWGLFAPVRLAGSGPNSECMEFIVDTTARREAEDALRRRSLHLQLLHRAAARLLVGQDPVQLLRELHSKIAEVFGADAFMLYQADPNNGHLHLVDCAGFSEEQRRRLESLRYGRAICAKPEEALRPIVATHILTGDAPNRRFVRKLGLRSYLYYPLILNERLHGTVAFASRRRDDYDRFDLDFFHTIAGTLAEALERERLQVELKLHTAELERRVQRRTAKLRETIAELEGFSYSLVHDMRAPLRAMQAYACILEEEMGPRLRDDESDFLRRIKLASNRMDQLITDSLNYSRILREELPLGPLDLGALLRGMVETYPNLQPPQAEVTIELSNLLVRGNEAALTQAFSNLLGNAVKFVAPGVKPKVRVWADQTAVAHDGGPESPKRETEPQSGRVRIWIQDNGIGIPREAHDTIFGMFQRLHGPEEYAGTGIGLALVKKSLERIGGQVWVESEIGKGSRFCVELPLARQVVNTVRSPA